MGIFHHMAGRSGKVHPTVGTGHKADVFFLSGFAVGLMPGAGDLLRRGQKRIVGAGGDAFRAAMVGADVVHIPLSVGVKHPRGAGGFGVQRLRARVFDDARLQRLPQLFPAEQISAFRKAGGPVAVGSGSRARAVVEKIIGVLHLVQNRLADAPAVDRIERLARPVRPKHDAVILITGQILHIHARFLFGYKPAACFALIIA